MSAKTFLKSIFSTQGNTTEEATSNTFVSTPSYLTHQEVSDILAELVEKDKTGQMIPPISAHPAYSQLTYVALVTIFPEEQRTQASCAGLCYIQFLDDHAPEGRVRVAALPSHLEATSQRKVHCLSLTKDQLCQILPWDRTLQRLETCCVREVLQEYVYQMSGVTIAAHPYTLGANGLPVQGQALTPVAKREHLEMPWTILPEVFVSTTTAQDLVGRIKESGEHKGKQIYPQRLFWLKTLISMLERQLIHLSAPKQAALGHLYMKLLGIAEHIMRSLKGRGKFECLNFLVQASAVRRNGSCLGWHLSIGLPQTALRAWGF